MKLVNLLNIIDGDTNVSVLGYSRKLFSGYMSEFYPMLLPFRVLESEVKALWYSTDSKSVVIEV